MTETKKRKDHSPAGGITNEGTGCPVRLSAAVICSFSSLIFQNLRLNSIARASQRRKNLSFLTFFPQILPTNCCLQQFGDSIPRTVKFLSGNLLTTKHFSSFKVAGNNPQAIHPMPQTKLPFLNGAGKHYHLPTPPPGFGHQGIDGAVRGCTKSGRGAVRH